MTQWKMENTMFKGTDEYNHIETINEAETLARKVADKLNLLDAKQFCKMKREEDKSMKEIAEAIRIKWALEQVMKDVEKLLG